MCSQFLYQSCWCPCPPQDQSRFCLFQNTEAQHQPSFSHFNSFFPFLHLPVSTVKVTSCWDGQKDRQTVPAAAGLQVTKARK